MTNRLDVVATLMMKDAQQVAAIKMIGLNFEDPSINRLGFGQSTGPMKR